MSLPQLIASNRVVIFSWVQCPYCVRAKQLFSTLTKDVTAYDIDRMPEGENIHQQIISQFNHETVPAIFVKGQFVGGFSDADAMHKAGKLVPLMQD